MAKTSISKMVEEMAKPIIENLGYELVEVKYAKGLSGMELTLFVHSVNGISLNDCEAISKAIDEPLDELNPTNDEPYSLNVSSLGLDRPIKDENDARRNLGAKVEVKLYAPTKEGVKNFEGTIRKYDSDTLTIQSESNEYTFKFVDIALCKPIIEF